MKGQDVWGWKVAAYLFASGMGAGAYTAGAAAQRFEGGPSSVAAVGLWLGPLLVGPATLFLIADLGRPAGFLRASRRPVSSWISRGVVILSAFLIASIVHAGLAVWPLGAPAQQARLAVAVVGGLLALLTMLYTGLLLGAIRPIPFWSTPILPVLFLVSSLSTGVMAVDLVSTAMSAAGATPASGILGTLRSLDLVLLALEATVLALYLAVTRATIAARASTALLITGALAPRFWAGVVLSGIALPFAVQLAEVTSAIAPGAAWTIVSSGAGLAGGFLLRHVVIAAAVKSPLNAAGVLFPAPARATAEAR